MNTYRLGLGQEEFEALKKELAPKKMETEEIFVSVTSAYSEEKPVDSVDQPRDVHLDIHHIDVNQGESTLIVMRYEGRCILSILIDGGLQRDGGGMLIRLLNQLGIESLDAVVVSHFDLDHYEGLTRVLNHYATFYRKKKEKTSGDEVEEDAFDDTPVDRDVFLSEGFNESNDYLILSSLKVGDDQLWKPIGVFNVFIRAEISTVAEAKGVQRPPEPGPVTEGAGKKRGKKKKLPALFEFEDAVTRSGAQLHYIAKDDELVLDCDADSAAGSKQFKLKCLCVNRGTSAESDDDENAHSIGWLLRFGKYTYYTAGDLPTQDHGNSLEDAVATDLAKALGGQPLTAIKCGHHGSRTSTSKPFLEKLKPPLVFISAGKRDGFGHPHNEVLLRIWEEPSVRALFLTNCVYNRPVINEDYEARTWQALREEAQDALSKLMALERQIDILKGDVAFKPSQGNCPALLLEVKQSLLDKVITPLSTALDVLDRTTDDAVTDEQLQALKPPLDAFETWLRNTDSSYVRNELKQGLQIIRDRHEVTLRADVSTQEATDPAKTALKVAVSRSAEFIEARKSLKTDRKASLFTLVAGTETTLGNNVLRMNLLDAHLDARCAFVGASFQGSWRWYPCGFGGIDISAIPPPTNDYQALMEPKKLKDLKPPDSPGTFDTYVTDRTENRKRRGSFVTRPEDVDGDLLGHERKRKRLEHTPPPFTFLTPPTDGGHGDGGSTSTSLFDIS